MQINRQANSSARAKGFVNRTKDLLSAFTTSFKYPELKSSPATPPTFEKQTIALTSYESDLELSYPAPPFTRRRTSSSQLSGSTKSTSTGRSSIFSHHTDRTAITAAGEESVSDLDKEGIAAVEVSRPAWHGSVGLAHPNEPARGSFSTQIESNDDEDHSEPSSEEGEEDDEGMLLIHSKRRPLQHGFATSLSRNPYEAFLSQPLYKPSYIFPATRQSISLYDA